jgi:hypothetical protein
MCQGGRDLEDRVFALLGELKTPQEIVRELDLDAHEGHALVCKVIEERGTPHSNALRVAIERLAAIQI